MLDFSKIAWNLNRDWIKPRDELENNNVEQSNQLNQQQDNQDQVQTPASNTQRTWVEPMQTQPTGQWLPQYFNRLNEWLNKLTWFKWTFSPEQRRKIASVYSTARNKYNLSNKTPEETEAFNWLRNNPIWWMFNKNQ